MLLKNNLIKFSKLQFQMEMLVMRSIKTGVQLMLRTVKSIKEMMRAVN
jgi:hypothetical protein